MSHIVIHDDSNNVTHYAPFDDIEAAAAFLEELHNADGATSARLFALEEVQFAVRSYVKVEIGDAAPPTPAPEMEPEPVFTDATADEASEDEIEPTDEIDTVEYVEAAMAPVESYGPGADTVDEAPAGEPRRGLFGR